MRGRGPQFALLPDRLPTPMPLPQRPVLSSALAGCCALLLAGGVGHAAWAATPAAPTKPAAKTVARPAAKPAAKPVAKAALKTAPATPRQQAKDAAKGLALATETTEAINEAQLDIATRVLTGAADCEFKQQVTVQPLQGQAGHFTVSHLGRHYRMVPRETSTGAVRLEDPVNGIVWLQIPAKSMLMNARRGQRMVDSCMHAEQHAAVAAATAAGQAAGQGIGIVPQAAAAAPASVSASAPAPAPTAAASAPAETASAPAQPASAPSQAASAPSEAASATAQPAPAPTQPAPPASAPAAMPADAAASR